MTEESKVEQPAQAAVAITESTQEMQTPQVENIEEINWRKFRQQREEERKQKEAAIAHAKQKEQEAEALKRAMEALVNKPAYGRQEEEELSDDQKIDKRVNEALRLRELELEKQRVERERAEFPQKLQSTFRDFNEVCTTENLDYLEYHYPEVAKPYKHMQDGYEKWEGIYQALKRFIPNKNSVKDANKAEKNLSKPQAMSKPGATQTGDHAPMTSLDDSKRRANWERMQKVMKGI
jgi:hypothetical protein